MAEVEEVVVTAECHCCMLTEECTPPYVQSVKQKHAGRWVCGLCSEALKEEMKEGCSLEEAMRRHAAFCMSARNPVPLTNERLLEAFWQLLARRRLRARAAARAAAAVAPDPAPAPAPAPAPGAS